MASRGANHFQLLSRPNAWFAAAREVEGLADPLSDRHASRTRYALNFAVFLILQNYLQSLGHGYESI